MFAGGESEGFRGMPATNTVRWNDLSCREGCGTATSLDRSRRAVARANTFLVYQWICLKLSCVTSSSERDSTWKPEASAGCHHPNRQDTHRATDGEPTSKSFCIARYAWDSQTVEAEAPKPFLSSWTSDMWLSKARREIIKQYFKFHSWGWHVGNGKAETHREKH